MAYGDVNYEIAKTASVAYATTALSQLLLLTDNSLSSTFNLDEVFVLQVVQLILPYVKTVVVLIIAL